MKKIIKPMQFEEAMYFLDFSGRPFGEAMYFSDFSGRPLGIFGPPVTLKIEFNYDSIYDQSKITLHLDDKDMVPILELIKNKLNPDCKKQIEDDLDENSEEYNKAIDSKDVSSCEIYASTKHLLRTLIGEENV
jgi:hypothetical protein